MCYQPGLSILEKAVNGVETVCPVWAGLLFFFYLGRLAVVLWGGREAERHDWLTHGQPCPSLACSCPAGR